MTRRRIALRFLLLSSLTIMATACPSSLDTSVPPVTLQGEVRELTAAPPRVERRLSLRVTPKEGLKATLSSVSVKFEAVPIWRGLSGDASEVQPWLRVRLVDEHDERLIAERLFLADRTSGSSQVGDFFNMVCHETPRCETTLRAEFERQGAPAGGSVDVFWGVTVSAYGDESSGDDFELSLMEP